LRAAEAQEHCGGGKSRAGLQELAAVHSVGFAFIIHDSHWQFILMDCGGGGTAHIFLRFNRRFSVIKTV
jgi:hypothetical protein